MTVGWMDFSVLASGRALYAVYVLGAVACCGSFNASLPESVEQAFGQASPGFAIEAGCAYGR